MNILRILSTFIDNTGFINITCLSRSCRSLITERFFIPSISQIEFFESFYERNNIILHAPAGFGKSFCVNFIRKRSSNITISSTTGITAILVNGITVHSFIFNLEKYPVPYLSLETLIVDEISMFNEEQMKELDLVMRKTYDSSKYFGGKQVIFIGDFLQLPPVEGLPILFSYYLPEMNFKFLTLESCFRQTDSCFINILSNIRNGIPKDLHKLDILKDTVFPDDGIKPTIIVSKKNTANDINNIENNLLKTPKILYKTIIYDKYLAKSIETRLPDEISLTIGSQVMCVANIDVKNGIANGTKGVVIGFSNQMPLVKFTTCERIMDMYDEYEYSTNIKSRKKIRSQIPLILAWAITIHKSQGSTLDRVIVDCSDIWLPGQFYTAISRTRSMNSIKLINFDPKKHIKANSVMIKHITQIKKDGIEKSIKSLKLSKDQVYEEKISSLNAMITCFSTTDKAFVQELHKHKKDFIEKLFNLDKDKDIVLKANHDYTEKVFSMIKNHNNPIVFTQEDKNFLKNYLEDTFKAHRTYKDKLIECKKRIVILVKLDMSYVGDFSSDDLNFNMEDAKKNGVKWLDILVERLINHLNCTRNDILQVLKDFINKKK